MIDVAYDESSYTCLAWKTERAAGGRRKGRAKIGDVAGSYSNSHGYFEIQINKKKYLCHRIIYEMFYGPIPEGFEVDHQDRNRIKNEIWNLRLVEGKFNQRNLSKCASNVSGVTGVYRTKRKQGRSDVWVAQWEDMTTGKPTNKKWSIRKYGEQGAFKLACAHRTAMIEKQNKLGAGYTESHGK